MESSDVKVAEADVAVLNTETGHLQRKLQARHLEMIAIGGTIGTGLLLRSGGAIASAGPIGALICFIIAGAQVYGVAAAIGEMVTYIPVEGAFSSLPTRFVSPAFGFMSGWNYWANWALTFPVEMTGIANLMAHWVPKDKVAGWVWSTVFSIPILVLNLFPVRGFAELEFVLCIIKVVAIGLFIFAGLLVWFGVGTGQGFLAFKNWNPAIVGGDSTTQFVNITGALTTAFFSYGGTELVGLTAGEAANPRKSVPRAINGTFYRIIIFYLGSLFLVGLLLNPSDPVLQAADIATSPFVWAFNRIGIAPAADIMNFVIIVAATSAANSSVYACARTLMRLAEEGSAPRIAGYVDKRGVPLFSWVIVTVFAALAIVLENALGPDGNLKAYSFFGNVISYGIMLAWMVMSYTHLRFRYGYVAQGKKVEDLPYIAPLFPYLDYMSLTIGTFVTGCLLFSAFYQNGFTPSDDCPTFFCGTWFINNAWIPIGVPITILLYVGYGLVKPGSFKLVKYEDMDFETDKYIEKAEELEELKAVHEKPKNLQEWGRRIWYKLF